MLEVTTHSLKEAADVLADTEFYYTCARLCRGQLVFDTRRAAPLLIDRHIVRK